MGMKINNTQGNIIVTDDRVFITMRQDTDIIMVDPASLTALINALQTIKETVNG